MWFRRSRTCGFCGRRFARRLDACPKCAWPADGDLERKRRTPASPAAERCALCGREFPAGRPACPHCGSDEQTGWKDPYGVEGAAADVPDAFTEEDYEEVVQGIEAERGRLPESFWRTAKARRMVVGILLVLAMTVPLVLALRMLAGR